MTEGTSICLVTMEWIELTAYADRKPRFRQSFRQAPPHPEPSLAGARVERDLVEYGLLLLRLQAKEDERRPVWRWLCRLFPWFRLRGLSRAHRSVMGH